MLGPLLVKASLGLGGLLRCPVLGFNLAILDPHPSQDLFHLLHTGNRSLSCLLPLGLNEWGFLFRFLSSSTSHLCSFTLSSWFIKSHNDSF